MTDSEPVPRHLLRLLNDMPGVELVSVAGSRFISATCLDELHPDLLVLDIESRQQESTKLFEYLLQRLPGCKTIVFARQASTESLMASFVSHACIVANKSSDSTSFQPDKRLANKHTLAEKADTECAPVTTVAAGYNSPCLSIPGRQGALHANTRGSSDRRKKFGGRRHSEINRLATQQFQSFVEQLPGMPYIESLDHDGRTIYVSPRIKEFLGFTPDQWRNDPTLRVRQLHADDRTKVLQARQQALDTKQGYCIDYRIHANDGSAHWFHDEAHVMTDDVGMPVFLQGVILDITERKQAQEQLEKSHRELQDLIAALDALRAEEQKRLAHEMHDDFGQLLAAMKLDLCTLQQRVPPENAEALKYLRSINELVDSMVTSVRRIIADLPPKLVEDLGLFHALRALVNNFEQRHRIACDMQLLGAPAEPAAKLATALYRIVQEALNNVAKHANATSVKVAIHCRNTSIGVSINDNGTGMRIQSTRKAESFGLIGMRERVLALGGRMKIESGEGQGTKIRIVIPLVAP